MARPLPMSPPEQYGVFTTAQAHAAGWSPGALHNAVRHGRLLRLARGVHAPAELWAGTGIDAQVRRAMMRSVAGVLAIRSSAASHTSAALLDGMPVWSRPHRACVTVNPRYTGDAGCAHLHRARLLPEHVAVDRTIARTTPARTVLDTAREHGIEDAVVMGDYAVRNGLTDTDQLTRCARSCAGWPGIRRARAMIDILDPRSESPLESGSRVRLSFTRIPPPDLQPCIYDLGGRFLGRLDFYWDEFGVAGEADGRLKYLIDPNDPEQSEAFWLEKQRQQLLEECGVFFVRWGRSDLAAMSRLVTRIETQFARGQRRSSADRRWIVRRTPALPRQFQ